MALVVLVLNVTASFQQTAWSVVAARHVALARLEGSTEFVETKLLGLTRWGDALSAQELARVVLVGGGRLTGAIHRQLVHRIPLVHAKRSRAGRAEPLGLEGRLRLFLACYPSTLHAVPLIHVVDDGRSTRESELDGRAFRASPHFNNRFTLSADCLDVAPCIANVVEG